MTSFSKGIYYYKTCLTEKDTVTVKYNFGAVPNNIINTFLHNLSYSKVMVELDEKIKHNNFIKLNNDINYLKTMVSNYEEECRNCANNKYKYSYELLIETASDLEEHHDRLMVIVLKENLTKDDKNQLLINLTITDNVLNDIIHTFIRY